MKNILDIKGLRVAYHTEDGTVHALNGIDLELKDGETLGLVGETGAGKTTLAKSIMRLIPNPPGKIEAGDILFRDTDITKASESEIRNIRGSKISMIFQDPMSALNPVLTVGEQIQEAISVHENITSKQAWQKALDMLALVGISKDRATDYPHQFSGGMKQRVIIAIALSCNPEVLIADEPTTALDVTIQAQVLALMQDLKKKFNTATILITHDLGIVAQMCENVSILYAGEIVESGSVKDIFKHTAHPYTKGLLGAIPNIYVDTKRLKPIDGLMPDPMILPSGCVFYDRCKYSDESCNNNHPDLRAVSETHKVRCFKPVNEEVSEKNR